MPPQYEGLTRRRRGRFFRRFRLSARGGTSQAGVFPPRQLPLPLRATVRTSAEIRQSFWTFSGQRVSSLPSSPLCGQRATCSPMPAWCSSGRLPQGGEAQLPVSVPTCRAIWAANTNDWFRGLHRAPPHDLRNAGQLQLRRLRFKRDAITYAWGCSPACEDSRRAPARDRVPDDREPTTSGTAGRPAGGRSSVGDNKAPLCPRTTSQMADAALRTCTEIFYDHGAHIPGGPPGCRRRRRAASSRIWNNVFTVRPQRRRRFHAVARALRRYRHGPGASRPCCSACTPTTIDLFQHLIRSSALTATAGILRTSRACHR